MPQQQQNPALSLLFVLFIIWIVFPGAEYPAQSLLLSDLAAERLSGYRNALDVLNRTKWGDFSPPQGDTATSTGRYLNLTGFREEDGFAWQDLDRFRERSLQFSRYAVPSPRGQQLWDLAEGEPIWGNASGTIHGEWVRKPGSSPRVPASYNLTHSVPSMHWMGDRFEWARNITGDSGSMLLRIDENKTVNTYEQLPMDHAPLSGGSIRNLKATATIEDTAGSGLNWDMRLWGVHWPRQGVILMTTTSEKFEGVFGLPHLSLSSDYFQSSQRLLNETLAATIAKKEENLYIDQNMPWNSDMDNPIYTTTPAPHCEYVVYAQIHPPSPKHLGMGSFDPERGNMAEMIQGIESELETPLGAPIRGVPMLQMSTIVYSPDCGFFLESKGPPDFPPGEAEHLTGMKTEVHLHEIKTWLLIYAVVVFGQVFLLKNQMRDSYTPSTMGRISFGTTSIMVIVDGMTFTAAATWVSSAAGTFLPTLALMFAAFLSMTIGGSFLAKIHEVQIPENRGPRGRNQTTSGSATGAATPQPATPAPTTDAGTGPILPGPVTAARPAASVSLPVVVPSDQDVDAEIAADGATPIPDLVPAARQQQPQQSPNQTFQSIIGRYILLSLCISFLAISSTTWYPTLRSWFLNICVFAYFSLWVPQIYRNTLRNCRRALTWQFVIGQSLLRLLPIAYFWVKADNFLYARTDNTAFFALCLWVWLQLFVLAAQEIVGPRFGIPASWTPDAWDYHPVLREDNLEAGGLPIGLVAEDNPGLERAGAGDGGDKRRTEMRAIDCTICREALEVPVVKAGEEVASVAGAFARRTYMVTPCRHIFHTACLEGWMRFRLQCPICREELPPL